MNTEARAVRVGPGAPRRRRAARDAAHRATRIGVALAVGAAAFVAPAAAQSPRMELGLDAAVQLSFPDEGDRLTTVEVPLGRVRVGNYLGARTLIEAGGGFALASQSGESASAGRGELSVSYHFGVDARRARPFVLAGGAARFAHRDEETAWQGLAIGGIGVKIPVRRVLGVRLEADYARAFETSELEASHEIRALLGLSFYLGG